MKFTGVSPVFHAIGRSTAYRTGESPPIRRPGARPPSCVLFVLEAYLMRLPIGKLLIQQGVITQEQCDKVLARQIKTQRPFGEIAEEMLGISARAVEKAWAEQYAAETRWLDAAIEQPDPATRDLVTRRQAWQFRIFPLGYDGNELMICTTQDFLVRAMNFVSRQLPVPCFFVLSEPESLGMALMRHYPMDGMTVESITRGIAA
jgi:hypothetical protein